MSYQPVPPTGNQPGNFIFDVKLEASQMCHFIPFIKGLLGKKH